MRSNRIRDLLFASFLATAAVAAAPAAAQQPYDGLWQVTVVTKSGSCDAQTASTVTVNDGKGMESAEEGLRRVIDEFKWRRSCAAHQASKSLLVERPSETAKLTEKTRELLEQAARFHRERTAK